METSQKENGEEKFQKFVSDTVRGPKKGVYEHLLAQHLALAVTSYPLKKIQYICEACFMISEEERVKQEIDMEDIDIIHKVCMSFANSVNEKLFDDMLYRRLIEVSISWAFGETVENHRKYIKPWIVHTPEYYRNAVPEYQYERLADLEEQIEEAVRKIKKAQNDPEFREKCEAERINVFFIISKYLSQRSFMNLQSDFVVWALPKIQQVYAKLARLVPPRLLRETMSLMKPQYAQSEEHASSMG